MAGQHTDKPFRPMLAFDAPIEHYIGKLRTQSLWASPKMDGIRALVINGQLRSRSMKLIPNRFTQAKFAIPENEGLDGELVVGEPFGDKVFARTSSGVMSHDGQPDVRFIVFDDITQQGRSFSERLGSLDGRISKGLVIEKPVNWELTEQKQVSDAQELVDLEALSLEMGYEGLILKAPWANYKQGRSTLKEGIMGKLKRFKDGEAHIIGFIELFRNMNDPTQNERGYQVRSSAKAGQVPADTLGAFIVQDVVNEAWMFNVGSGMDAEFRSKVWRNQDEFLGKTICYKYLPIGTVDLPRHPTFKGMRHPIDM